MNVREPAMMSFMRASLVWGLPNKKSRPLPRCFSEGCVLQRHAGVAGLPMASVSQEGVG